MTSPPADDDRTVMPARNAAGAQPKPVSLGHNALDVGTLIAEFEILGLVGEGGFGIVYLAYDQSLKRKVALKEYMPSDLAHRQGGKTGAPTDLFRAMEKKQPPAIVVKSPRHAETFAAGLKSFINEARLLAQFDHPSLVKVHRFWEANGTAYMVMPFYEGITLKEALRRLGGPPDEAWLKWLLAQLLDALEIIHSQQCYHRDIAPDNILILSDETPLLLDFGAARRVIGDMTQALTVILKPGYAPIEQYAEEPNMKQGAWTDLYALASVVYFAITGQAPVAAVARVISDPMVPLSQSAAGQYSDVFLRGIDCALAVKPQDRPQSIAEFRRMLGFAEREVTTRYPSPDDASALPGVPSRTVTGRTKSRPSPQKAKPGRSKLMGIGGAALGVVLVSAYVRYIFLDEPLESGPAPVSPQPSAPAEAAAASDAAAEAKAKLAAFDCARLEPALSANTVTVRGHVSREVDLQRIGTELGAIKGVQQVNHSAVKVFPPPYCEVVSVLAPYADQTGGPTIGIKGGGSAAFDGDRLVTEVTSAAFPGYVYADLYEPEGNVVHLLPNPKEKKNQLQPRQRIVLGDDTAFGMQWDVVAPFGKHLLVVMASRSGMFKQDRPAIEPIGGYLGAVRETLNGKPSGEPFVVHYALIEFLPRR